MDVKGGVTLSGTQGAILRQLTGIIEPVVIKEPSRVQAALKLERMQLVKVMYQPNWVEIIDGERVWCWGVAILLAERGRTFVNAPSIFKSRR